MPAPIFLRMQKIPPSGHSIAVRAEALGLEVIQESGDGHDGRPRGRGLIAATGGEGFAAGVVIGYQHGEWRLQHAESTGVTINVDNWKIKHSLFKNIVLGCEGGVMGLINDIKGTNAAANVKAICAFTFRTSKAEVLEFMQRCPWRILEIRTTEKIAPGEQLLLDYGEPYWTTLDAAEEEHGDTTEEEAGGSGDDSAGGGGGIGSVTLAELNKDPKFASDDENVEGTEEAITEETAVDFGMKRTPARKKTGVRAGKRQKIDPRSVKGLRKTGGVRKPR